MTERDDVPIRKEKPRFRLEIMTADEGINWEWYLHPMNDTASLIPKKIIPHYTPFL